MIRRSSCTSHLGRRKRSTTSTSPSRAEHPCPLATCGKRIGVTCGLAELWPRRGVNDDGPPIGQRADPVPRIARHDRGHARASDLRDAVDRELEFAFELLVQLLLRMVMLMNRGAASEFVVRDGHVDGMEVSPSPTRQAFGHLELVDINE